MRYIRIRLNIVTALLLVAVGLTATLYLKGSSSISTPETEFFCGTVSPYPIKNNLQGRELFTKNCASCHSIYKDLTGPALENFNERFPMEDFMLFIKDPEKAIKKQPYLQALAKKYNSTAHPAFTKLTKHDLDDITEYIKQSSRN